MSWQEHVSLLLLLSAAHSLIEFLSLGEPIQITAGFPLQKTMSQPTMCDTRHMYLSTLEFGVNSQMGKSRRDTAMGGSSSSSRLTQQAIVPSVSSKWKTKSASRAPTFTAEKWELLLLCSSTSSSKSSSMPLLLSPHVSLVACTRRDPERLNSSRTATRYCVMARNETKKLLINPDTDNWKATYSNELSLSLSL